MLFSTFEFVFYFMPAVIAGYYFCNHFFPAVVAKLWLVFASLFFYGWWNAAYLWLLLGSIALNYIVSIYIINTDTKTAYLKRKSAFVVGVLCNLCLLGYFKYANFFVDNFNALLGQEYFLAKIILPLGISFFTIQQIAYLVDVYEGLVEEKHFVDYSLFVTFFPHLLAGPILHHKQMIPQFAAMKSHAFDHKNFAVGTFLFSVGLFKKVIIADSLAVWVGNAYGLTDTLSTLDAWVASMGYMFQLYFDFSGYVDMALALSLMLNITLPKNFDSPLRATSVINFWERWHITLSKFITTYVYSPIVRSFSGRVTFAKSMFAMMLSMFVSGLWHGAAWTYVLFGILHGVALVINHIWRRQKLKMPTWFAWLITYLFVMCTLVPVRAHSMEKTLEVWSAMLGLPAYAGAWFDLHSIAATDIAWMPFVSSEMLQWIWMPQLLLAISFSLIWAVCLLCRNSGTIYEQFRPDWRHLLFQVFLFVPPIFMMNRVVEFVYFQF